MQLSHGNGIREHGREISDFDCATCASAKRKEHPVVGHFEVECRMEGHGFGLGTRGLLSSSLIRRRALVGVGMQRSDQPTKSVVFGNAVKPNHASDRQALDDKGGFASRSTMAKTRG
jgi:hypothetical protein